MRFERRYAGTEEEALKLLAPHRHRVLVSVMGTMAGSDLPMRISHRRAAGFVRGSGNRRGFAIAVDFLEDGAYVRPVDLFEAHSTCPPGAVRCDIPRCWPDD